MLKPHNKINHKIITIITLFKFAFLGDVFANEICGPLKMSFSGPWDYRSDKDKINLVERAHFTPKVEKLISGQAGHLAEDINYTLIHFPNHPRALISMMRLSEREKVERPKGAEFSIECYIVRAIRFTPDDGTIQMIAGMYYSKKGNNAKALEYLERASELSGESGNLHYNLGLVFFELKTFDKALFHAHEAYRLGFTLPGLKSKLEKIGKWHEPGELN